jgi:NAD(P)-dependent dehydrogenase (short-subunit alcohol dehydrogenase family)
LIVFPQREYLSASKNIRNNPTSYMRFKMKIIVIGASGSVGKAVAAELAQRHEVIKVGKTSGEHQADITDIASVRDLFGRIGKVDAVVLAAGSLHFGPLADMTPEQFGIGLKDKLMGQVNVVLAGQDYVNDGGSFTLISGIVGEEPIRYGANATTVNAAVEGFARAAAIELPRGLRINVVNARNRWRLTGRISAASRRCRPAAWRWRIAAAWRGRRRAGYIGFGKFVSGSMQSAFFRRSARSAGLALPGRQDQRPQQHPCGRAKEHPGEGGAHPAFRQPMGQGDAGRHGEQAADCQRQAHRPIHPLGVAVNRQGNHRAGRDECQRQALGNGLALTEPSGENRRRHQTAADTQQAHRTASDNADQRHRAQVESAGGFDGGSDAMHIEQVQRQKQKKNAEQGAQDHGLYAGRNVRHQQGRARSQKADLDRGRHGNRMPLVIAPPGDEKIRDHHDQHRPLRRRLIHAEYQDQQGNGDDAAANAEKTAKKSQRCA